METVREWHNYKEREEEEEEEETAIVAVEG